MKGQQRIRTALQRGKADCVPVLPQIWLDHAARVSGIAPLDIIQRPELGWRAMLQTARHYELDGFRTFLIYEPRRVQREGDQVYELDRQTGEKIGVIDMDGGWATRPFMPRRHVESLDDVAQIQVRPAQSYWDNGMCPALAQIVQEAGEEHMVAGRPIGFTMNYLLSEGGAESGIYLLYDKPDVVHALFQKGLAIAIEQTRAMRRAGIELFMLGDASASCDVISPTHFREFVFPYYKLYCDEVHRMGGLVYVHVCGDQTPLAEMLADSGVDCIEPMDPLGGVDPAEMKRRVGDRVALMGGVSTLTLLRGTPEQVEVEARECIRKAGYNGGYILAAGCMVPRDTPEANIRAMVRVAHG
jgi:uroporphyrinogen-III decarboxylase